MVDEENNKNTNRLTSFKGALKKYEIVLKKQDEELDNDMTLIVRVRIISFILMTISPILKIVFLTFD